MKERTKLGLGVLEAALLLGLLGDVLLRAEPWGLNVFLWVGALAAAMLALGRQRRSALAREGGWLLPAALVFAAAFAWRDSPTLRLLDLLAVLAALALLAAEQSRAVRFRLAGVSEYAFAAVAATLNAWFGAFALLFVDIGWKEIPREGWTRHALAVARGLALAVPLVLVFGALFMAADAAYEGLVRNTFGIDAGLAFTHVLLFGFFSWTAAGFLRGTFLSGGVAATADEGHAAVTINPPARSVTADSETHATAAAKKGDENCAQANEGRERANSDRASGDEIGAQGGENYPAAGRGAVGAGGGARGNMAGRAAAFLHGHVSLGIVEVGVVLGLLDVLFFSFVMVQLRYFFGGAGFVLDSEGLTFAEYARRGFFELVWVAALVLPLLLAAHWLLRKDRPANERLFRVLAGVQIALLFVIMASALGRMRLYQGEYGQTELRLYTTAFMGWLAVVFVWFALTVLRGQRERFACGAFVAGLFVVGALHVVNPDDMIVRTNVALAARQRHFDAAYAAGLSADAVPALLRALPGMPPQERGLVSDRMLNFLSRQERTDWRSWNWSRAGARRLIMENETSLREWARRQSEGAETMQPVILSPAAAE